MNVEAIQKALVAEDLDGWLFFDHHRRDPLAYRILQLGDELQPTRRWYYFIPRVGEPRALCHRIESHHLDALPGTKRYYSRWSEQQAELRLLLRSARAIAMQYSPECAVPYVAMVDAGTVELIRSLGIEIRSSANLVQLFEARWTEQQLATHFEAGRRVDRIRADAFDLIRERVRNGAEVNEWQVRSFILDLFRKQGLQTDHGPIVAVNANASDPHYEPTADRYMPIGPNDLVLIDMWAKLEDHGSVYYDITWTGFCGEPNAEVKQVFAVVSKARNSAIEFVQHSIKAKKEICGFEVDDVARGYIEREGFGEKFIHRTGHSIGTDVHGAGANMDNFETHDERRIIPWTCFSIEPGVYLPDFGIRSEVNVFVGEDGARVTGEIQTELLIL